MPALPSEVTRFNEAIDEAICESVEYYSMEVERWRDILRASRPDAGVVLDAPDELRGMFDEASILEALANLVVNAWKYGADGSEVRVELRDRGGGLRGRGDLVPAGAAPELRRACLRRQMFEVSGCRFPGSGGDPPPSVRRAPQSAPRVYEVIDSEP